MDLLAGGLTPNPLGYDEGDIWVYGRRWWDYNSGSGGGGGGGQDSNTNEQEGMGGPYEPPPTPPDLSCLTEAELAQLTPEEREAYEIAKEAAEIAREIMSMPDKDENEYGSIIYRDSSGTITHTPLARGGPTSVSLSTEGTTNYGQILAIVHSHTAETFSDQFPDLKLYPTADNANAGHGDWYAFDWYSAAIVQSLQNDHGLFVDAALARAAQFRQYVLGPTGPEGSNQYELRGYMPNDRDQITLGQKVSLNLGLCHG